MMVKIYKIGNNPKTVSLQAFHNYYENFGWELDDSSIKKVQQSIDVKKIEDKHEVEEIEQETSDEEWDEAIMDDEEIEKPLTEMNHDELVDKAKSYGIDTVGMNNKQLRDAIKKANR